MLPLKLWLRFLGLHFQFRSRNLPIRDVAGDELLGREIFSKKQFNPNSRKVNRALFQPPRGSRDVSVTRLTLCGTELGTAIAKRHLKRRSAKTFYGFARVTALQVHEVGLAAMVTPKIANPFHSDIRFPADIDKDAQMDFERRLAEKSKLWFQPRLEESKV